MVELRMRLSEKQRLFSVAIAKLIIYADSLGYGLTFGDAYRDPRVSYGHKNSCHRSRLAVDFNLFINGTYSPHNKEHDKLHDYWDELGGAERIEKDLNHYSFEHNGVR